MRSHQGVSYPSMWFLAFSHQYWHNFSFQSHYYSSYTLEVDWLIDWMVFYATFNSISVISPQQLTLFMISWVSPVLGWALKCLAQGHSHKKPRGSSVAWTQDPWITSQTLYNWATWDPTLEVKGRKLPQHEFVATWNKQPPGCESDALSNKLLIREPNNKILDKDIWRFMVHQQPWSFNVQLKKNNSVNCKKTYM